jgi:hypothetical protein
LNGSCHGELVAAVAAAVKLLLRQLLLCVRSHDGVQVEAVEAAAVVVVDVAAAVAAARRPAQTQAEIVEISFSSCLQW